jgi:hypothetical protein
LAWSVEIVLMIENYRSGLLWRLMRQCPYLVSGLRRAGFSGGWLETHGAADRVGIASLRYQCGGHEEMASTPKGGA